jgi:penicillin amidase
MKSSRACCALRIVGLLLCLSLGARASAAQKQPLKGLGAAVDVYFDPHGIPHIYAQSWPDAARVLGYLHARDRLWQMDLFRRRASGQLAEVLGPEQLESDILMRRLGIREGCASLWKSDVVPEAMRAELTAYAEGVNAYLAQIGEAGLPAFFKLVGYKPEPWSPVDTLVFSKYMGWDQSGTMDDLWFGALVDKLGVAAAEELWPLERPYEVPTVKRQVDRKKLPTAATAGRTPRDGLVRRPGEGPIYLATYDRLSRAGWFDRGLSFGSNNWAVDGTKTVSGKPILCSDPHLGFNLPSIWYACHISVRGQNVAGVAFPIGPGIVIGHNDHIAWGITNMQSDAVDYFVETVDAAHPRRYLHKGEWKPIDSHAESIKVRGKPAHELTIERTVHGPIVEREGRVISMAWTGLGPTTDPIALWRFQHSGNLKEFLAACDLLICPALNLAYADVEGNIAIHPCGSLPLRLPGQGRIPMDGASGTNDWVGMIPRRDLPLSVNPPEHYVASANGRPSPLGYPYYLGWMWDPSYRTRRINEILAKSEKLTPEKMQAIQYDTHDLAAERFLPVFLAALRDSDVIDAVGKRARAELSKWDYVASVDSRAPALWLRWLDAYRNGVWKNKWAALGIKQPDGSWGFTGDNRREPMLEVLEYLTRDFPNSPWFDDRTTPDRETRDDIIRRTFHEMTASIKGQFGDDPVSWQWGKINKLKIDSLSGVPALGRTGTPVPGTAFTLNPGSDVGTVGGGASWRMIVDLADPQHSRGVYPGGQSGNLGSPHYDDQIAVWAAGRYLPLNAVSDPSQLSADTLRAQQTFAPP